MRSGSDIYVSAADGRRVNVPWRPSSDEYIFQTCPNSSRPREYITPQSWLIKFLLTDKIFLHSPPLINVDWFEYKGRGGLTHRFIRWKVRNQSSNSWRKKHSSRLFNVFQLLVQGQPLWASQLSCHVSVACYTEANKFKTVFVWPY